MEIQLQTLRDLTSKAIKATSWLVLADLHLHYRPEWRFEWLGGFLEDIETLTEFLPPTAGLVLLGDALEVKDRVAASVLNDLTMLIIRYARTGRPVVWLTGQHDSFEPCKATLFALGDLDNVYVVDDAPETIGCATFVPYSRDPAVYRRWLGASLNNDRLFTHMPINEVLRTFPGAKQDDRWIGQADFEGFDKVYSGDIHNECTFGNVEYIGAVSQRDWRDAGVEGCIGLVDADFNLTRIRVNHPRHVKVRTAKELATVKRPGEAPVIVRILGMSMTDAQLAGLREFEHILGVEWEPPLIEEDVEVEDAAALDSLSPRDRMQAYLGGLDIPEDGLSDEFLLECGEECLDED